MPLVKRAVEPVFISRATLDKQVKNELEGVVVNSLAGVIKQLSSISKHAENLFGELFSEANAIFQRTAGLNGRVQRLQERVIQLDSTAKEEVRVEEFSVQNHFKSTRKEEQQNLSRETLPTALYEVYHSCVRPPALHLFTPYRDDGKDGMKFFTDPNYFYDLWVKEQNRLLEKRKKKEKRKHRKKKDQNLKKVVKAAQKKQYASVDKEFITPEQRPVPQNVQPASDPAKPSPGPPSHEPPGQDYHMPPPPSAQMNIPNAPPPPPPPPGGPPLGAPPPPPLPPGQAAFQLPVGAPPPPPPPVASYDPSRAAPTPPTMHNFPKAPAPPPPPVSNAPPAPPPPTIPAAPAGGPPAPPLPGFPGNNPPAAPPAVVQEPPKPKPQQDERSALLRAIEMGMKLRRVERSDAEKQQQGQGSDVASILKRRIAVEMSDTESDSDDDSDDEDWSD